MPLLNIFGDLERFVLVLESGDRYHRHGASRCCHPAAVRCRAAHVFWLHHIRAGRLRPESALTVDEKLQKVLARRGLGSRRQLEKLIAEGRVKVNGEIAKLGDRVEETDRFQIDGRRSGRRR